MDGVPFPIQLAVFEAEPRSKTILVLTVDVSQNLVIAFYTVSGFVVRVFW